jgi:hypothetical protein
MYSIRQTYHFQSKSFCTFLNSAHSDADKKGPAVYTARALLRGLDQNRAEYINECEKVYPASSSNRESALQFKFENNLFSRGFTVSPNPAQSKITVTHDGNFQSIKITEISGKVVYESNLYASTNIQEFNVSGISNGVYIINLIANNKTERIKLVINK